MPRYAIAAAAVSTLFAALPVVTAAPQTTTPGQMTQARVWVQNRGRSEAVSVDLRDVTLERPLKVRVVNGEPGEADSGTALQTRAARQRWDYDTITVPSGRGIAGQLNVRGADGWEAVGIVSTTAEATTVLLKRPQ